LEEGSNFLSEVKSQIDQTATSLDNDKDGEKLSTPPPSSSDAIDEMMNSLASEAPTSKPRVKAKVKATSPKAGKGKGKTNDSEIKSLRETCKSLKLKLKSSSKKVDSLEKTVDVLNSDVKKLNEQLTRENETKSEVILRLKTDQETALEKMRKTHELSIKSEKTNAEQARKKLQNDILI